MINPYGINNDGSGCIVTLPNQDPEYGYAIISTFIASIIQERNNESNGKKYDAVFNGRIRGCRFINYGYTQQVYLITTDQNFQYALLINQPAAPKGAGYQEYINLLELSKKNPKLVINPIAYLESTETEAYVTPYHEMARCIGVEIDEGTWGVWVPNPYRRREFSEKERYIINSAMIASLIVLYDSEKEHGIAKSALDCGDFMLEKGYEDSEINLDTILDKMVLTACREFVKMSLDDYIFRIRIEYSNDVEDSERIITSSKLKRPFTKEEIESGINEGLRLRGEKRIKEPVLIKELDGQK